MPATAASRTSSISTIDAIRQRPAQQMTTSNVNLFRPPHNSLNSRAIFIYSRAALHQILGGFFVGDSIYKHPSFRLGGYLMAKKSTKRRAWIAEHVRTLKTLARKKRNI